MVKFKHKNGFTCEVTSIYNIQKFRQDKNNWEEIKVKKTSNSGEVKKVQSSSDKVASEAKK